MAYKYVVLHLATDPRKVHTEGWMGHETLKARFGKLINNGIHHDMRPETQIGTGPEQTMSHRQQQSSNKLPNGTDTQRTTPKGQAGHTNLESKRIRETWGQQFNPVEAQSNLSPPWETSQETKHPHVNLLMLSFANGRKPLPQPLKDNPSTKHHIH